MTGRALRIESGVPRENAIVLSTLDKIPAEWNLRATLEADSYWLKTLTSGGIRYTVITAPDDRCVLYGAFAFLRKCRSASQSPNSTSSTRPQLP